MPKTRGQLLKKKLSQTKQKVKKSEQSETENSSGSEESSYLESESEKTNESSKIVKLSTQVLEKFNFKSSQQNRKMDFKVPSHLVMDGNLSENFKKFQQRFEIYMCASESDKKPETVKIAILLNLIGDDAVDVFYTFPDEKVKTLESILKEFELYCNPKKDEVYERFKLYNRTQKEEETFDHFLTDVKRLASTCEFHEDELNKVIRDRIIFGIRSKSCQEKLLAVGNISLEDTIKKCRLFDIDKSRLEVVQNTKEHEAKEQSGSSSINIIKKGPSSNFNKFNSSYKNKFETKNQKHNPNQISNYNFPSKQDQYTKGYECCERCHKQHPPNKCPAFGKVCLKCNLKNHFAYACRTKKVNELSIQNSNENDQMDCIDNPDENETNFFIYDISTRKQNCWMESITVESTPISFKLDTGAEVNVLPTSYFTRLETNKQVRPCLRTLEAFGGELIRPKYSIVLTCSTSNKSLDQEFFIVDKNTVPILGIIACEKLGLIKRANVNTIQDPKPRVLEQNRDIFTGIGKFPIKCHLQIDNTVSPSVKPPRRLPATLIEPVKKALNELESTGIIKKVHSPKGWVSNLIIVEKSNKQIRVCLDPRDLNKALKPEKFLIPKFEEIRDKLCGMKFFSVLDLKHGFWQVELDEISSEYCTFSSPFGFFKFTRLPFGISVAPEIFQKYTYQNFSTLPGTFVYIDDLIVFGKDEREHDINLNLAFKKAREIGVKFNENKFQYKMKSVKYIGHIFSELGIAPDPDRVKAILNLENPSNKKELQSILGMINYVRSFIPNLAQISESLRELLKNNNDFVWLDSHTNTLNKIKQIISHAPILKMFDSLKPIVLQCDASKSGIGCCLMQSGAPLSFASRSLSSSEVGYAQIEKELLAITFACNKFHHYIYGRPITVQTDHKPLVNICKKELDKIYCTRLQRMKLKLIKYNLNVVYVPGKFLHIADLLSRSYLKTEMNNEEEDFNEVIHSLNISDYRKEQLKFETENDKVLAKLKTILKNKWPTSINKIDTNLKKFYEVRNDLFLEEDIIFLNDKIVVPLSLQKEYLDILHEDHLGINKTSKRAQSLVFWLTLNKDIENLVNNCSICQKHRSSERKEPIIQHVIPKLPFLKLGMDILDFANHPYLVLVDYYSKWLEIIELKNKSSLEIIKNLKNIFSTHGIPQEIIADNSPFNCAACLLFARENGIKLTFSSPYYPKSNGLAEKFVGIAKNLLRKSQASKTDINIALLEYRNTPLSGMQYSPAQLLFNRRVRTKVPIHDKLLAPEIPTNVEDSIQKSKNEIQNHFNKTSYIKRDFSSNESVWMQKPDKKWYPGKILYKCQEPRSYMVKLNEGGRYRRNKVHIRKRFHNTITPQREFVIPSYDRKVHNTRSRT